MFVWTGLGFLVPVVTFGALVLTELTIDWQFGNGYYSTHGWAIGLGVVLGGIFTAALGFVLKPRSSREVMDVETGERFILNEGDHSFFFMPVRWSGLAIGVIGIGVVIYDIIA